MTNEDLENLPSALDLAAFEQTPTGLFRVLGALPAWLKLDDAPEIDLAERFPLLELFLSDSAPVFELGTPPRLESEVWEENDATGNTLYLQATAVKLGSRKLVALELLPRERYTYQQLSHEYQLAEEEAKRQKEVAERATRAKSAFLATMSHEIRTPLNSIIGMADVLSSTSLTLEQQKCVEVLQRNGVGLLNLINDILDLAKVESGKIELESLPLDLRDVIARSVEVIDGPAKAKGLAIEQHVAPGVPNYLIGDPSRLRQIIINLLNNAVKFTEHGHLSVNVERDPEDSGPGCLRVGVSDTGIGIPEDKLARVFQSFSQADSSTTRKYGGTGLGLSISRQLAELMRGRMWVESEVGKGSTFFFTVKLGVQADQSVRVAAPAAQTSGPRLEGLRILLADDAEDNRFLILSYLKDSKCVIEIAKNGQEAADLFRAGHFDVVLMDVEMPVMDGYTGVKEIRRYEREAGLSATPVVALTAHAFADMAEKSREAGFTAHLTKPIRKATLLEALAGYSGRAQSAVPAPAPPVPDEVSDGLLIHVEQGMEDVVPGYLEKRRKDIQTYREAIASEDFETLIMLGHKMKGTGAGYGFPVLTEIGDAIEHAARHKDAKSVATSVDRLSSYVDRVKLEFAQ